MKRRIDDAVEASLLDACLEAEEESDWQALGDAVRVAEIVCAPKEDVLCYSIKHLAMRGRLSLVRQTVARFASRWAEATGDRWEPTPGTTELLEWRLGQ